MSEPIMEAEEAQFEADKLEEFYQKYEASSKNVQVAFNNYLSALKEETDAYVF